MRKENIKTEYFLYLVAVILTDNPLLFYFQKLLTQHRKNEVSEMIENKQEVSKDLEKALQALQQGRPKRREEEI